MKKKTFQFFQYLNHLLIISSFFLIFFFLYKSGVAREENINSKFIDYSVFFLIIFFIFFGLQFTNKNFKNNSLIFILSIIISIYFLEVLSTFVFKNRFSYSSHNEIKKKRL